MLLFFSRYKVEFSRGYIFCDDGITDFNIPVIFNLLGKLEGDTSEADNPKAQIKKIFLQPGKQEIS